MQRSFPARHVWALACAALVADVMAAYAARSLAVSVVPGFHSLILAPRAALWVQGALVILVPLHVLLAVAVWQRLRHGAEPSSRLST